MTLRTRITLLTLGLLAVSLAVIGGAIFGLLRSHLYSNLREELTDATRQAVNVINLNPDTFIFAPDASRSDFDTLLSSSLYLQIDFLLEDNPTAQSLLRGDKVARRPLTSLLGANVLLLSEADYGQLLKNGSVFAQVTLNPIDQPPVELRVQARMVEAYLGGTIYNVVLLIGKPIASIEATVREVTRIYVITSLIVLMMGSLLAYRLVRDTLEPLEWVTKRAEEVSERPQPLPELQGQNEVAALVRTLNRMLIRLNEAWESQGRFLADASHELRTPVTALLGHVGYLLRRTQLSPQQQESLETIQREGQRMKKLIADLLELSKSGGTWRVERSAVHLATLLEEIAEELERNFQTTTQQGQAGEIMVRVDPDLWVLGDNDRLHQVFTNLVSNAQKASAQQVILEAHPVQERVVIRVVDNGEGIPAEHLEHLFERFYRVDPSRDRQRGGTGLGLSIVKAIVEAHQGTVWVESTPGKGSTFSVSLPRAVAPQPLLD